MTEFQQELNRRQVIQPQSQEIFNLEQHENIINKTEPIIQEVVPDQLDQEMENIQSDSSKIRPKSLLSFEKFVQPKTPESLSQQSPQKLPKISFNQPKSFLIQRNQTNFDQKSNPVGQINTH